MVIYCLDMCDINTLDIENAAWQQLYVDSLLYKEGNYFVKDKTHCWQISMV